MKPIKYFTMLCFAFVALTIQAQDKIISLTSNFDKIIVSPHIEATFIKGNEPSIKVEHIVVPMEKLLFEVSGGTLQVYLEGAKTVTKTRKEQRNGWKQKTPIYKKTIAKVIVTYTDVKTFSVRGEEKIDFESPINQKDLTLRIYGSSEVSIKKAELDNLRVAIYGDSDLMIESGKIEKQRITAYGASNVRSVDVESKETKITSYGDGTFQFNVSDRLKVTSYGEANILYKGNPDIKKGIVIGESNIKRI